MELVECVLKQEASIASGKYSIALEKNTLQRKSQKFVAFL